MMMFVTRIGEMPLDLFMQLSNYTYGIRNVLHNNPIISKQISKMEETKKKYRTKYTQEEMVSKINKYLGS